MTTFRTTPGVTPDIRIRESRPRMTPQPAAQRFRDALDASAGTILDGVEAASDLVPGAGVVGAAVRGGRSGADEAGQVAGAEQAEGPGAAAGPAGQDLVQAGADRNTQYLLLQEQISAENRRFTTLSNVLKARHDTAKAAIHNIK